MLGEDTRSCALRVSVELAAPAPHTIAGTARRPAGGTAMTDELRTVGTRNACGRGSGMARPLKSVSPLGEGTAQVSLGASTIDLRRRGEHAVLRLSGGLTESSGGHLAEALDWLADLGADQVRVELGGIEEVDAACLRTLRAARARLRHRGGQLTVVVARPEVRLALTLTGLSDSTPAGRATLGQPLTEPSDERT